MFEHHSSSPLSMARASRTREGCRIENPLPKAALRFSGSRDRYQLPWAMQEVGLLERLVTDLYWPNETPLGRRVGKWFPKVMARHSPGLPAVRVTTPLRVMAESVLMRTALASRRRQVRLDRSLGHHARMLAWRLQAAVFSY